jgi:uncharacterized protein (TIGR03437 family)
MKTSLRFSALLLWVSLSFAQQTIDTIAGNGMKQQVYGIPATQFSFSVPKYLNVDASGSIFVADDALERVYKIGTDGKLALFAGTGRHEFNGFSGPATEVSFKYPGGIVFDKSGNTYIADRENGVVRKVAPNGFSTTAAGCNNCWEFGEGILATQRTIGAESIGMDAAGNLYILETARILKVDAQGLITTVVGAPGPWPQDGSQHGFSADGTPVTQAKISNPKWLAFDGNGNMLFAESGNQRIRKVTPQGTLATVAGGGSKQIQDGLTGPEVQPGPVSGMSFDSTGNLYFVSRSSIVRMNPAGVLKIIAGIEFKPGFSGDGGPATQALLYSPFQVAANADGSVVFTDTENGRIRRIGTDGIIQTIAGGGTNYGGDGGAAKQSYLDRPEGLAFDGNGNLYVADTYNHRIRKLDANGTISTVAGNGTAGFSGDNGPAVNAMLSFPRDVALDAQGNLYIADQLNHRIRKVGRDGVIATVVGTGQTCGQYDNVAALNGCIKEPMGVSVDRWGNLYIAGDGHFVWKVDHSGVLRILAGSGGWAYGGDGGPAVSAALNNVRSTAPDAVGGFYIADNSNARVRYVSPSGTINTFAGGGYLQEEKATFIAKDAFYDAVFDVALGPDGGLFVTHGAGISKATSDGRTSIVAGDLSGGIQAGFSGDGSLARGALMNQPKGVTVDSAGDLYFTDTGNNRIRKVSFPLKAIPEAKPTIVSAGSYGEYTDISANAWVVIKGTKLAPPSSAVPSTWDASPEFATGKMPTQWSGVSVTFNGKPGFMYYVSETQLNVLAPVDLGTGSVQIVVSNYAGSSAPFTVTARALTPAFPVTDSAGNIAARHANYDYLGPAARAGFTPARPGETILLYGFGFGLPTTTLMNGSPGQFGSLASLPTIRIGGVAVTVEFAGVVAPGLYQFNVVVPSGAANGPNVVTASYGGVTTPAGTVIEVQR